MLLAFVSPTILITVAVFIAFSTGVWFVLDLFNRKEQRAEDRLDLLSDPRRKAERENEARESKKSKHLLEFSRKPRLHSPNH